MRSVANRRDLLPQQRELVSEPEIEVEIDHRSPRSPELEIRDDCGEKPRRLATRDGAVIDRQRQRQDRMNRGLAVERDATSSRTRPAPKMATVGGCTIGFA